MNTKDPPLENLKLIINLLNQKNFNQSLALSTELLAEFPKSILLFNIIGASNSGLYQFDDAIKSYQNAIQINPNYAEAYYNMGIAYRNLDSYKLAIDCYSKALEINPKYANANYNLGNALKSIGDLKGAIQNYKKAIKNKPDFIDAHNNLGNALMDIGEHESAIEIYFKAIRINQNYTDTFKNIAKALKLMSFTEPNSNLQEIISFIISQKNIIKPVDLSRAAISLIKVDPSLNEILKLNLNDELNQSVENIVSALSKNTLLLKLMSISLIPDPKLETFLRCIRYNVLISLNKIELTSSLLKFQSALALHCFTNEYVYYQNDKETKLVEILENKIENSLLKGIQPKSTLVLCLASFKPLYQYKWSNLIKITTDINEVVTRQIREPKFEVQLKSDLPRLQKITNHISSKVRDQYEDNPYPRWIHTGLSPKPAKFSEINKNLGLRLFDKKILEIDAPKILIAGCGTGQQSINVASIFKNAKILAVDLSLSSLAYAKRKTIELGINNIEYMQADILSLEKLNKKFDIIMCSGVLHHMDKPMNGWKNLKNCLKGGGLMKIGLYSNYARKHIKKIKEEINELDIGSNDYAIKTFRSNLMNSSEEHHKKLKRSNNFYSLSEIRDLIFHVQEHRFTIPEINKCLIELDLNFCGFDSDEVIKDFKKIYFKNDDLYNLDKWHQFEESNQDIFIKMYQFWCQKNS
jgi:tetratricopeptide (TPR) repeat protein